MVAGGGGSGAAAFVRHSVPLGPYGQVTQGNNVGDIDGDGRPDVVVGGDNYLVWYHNPDWAPHVIFQGPTTGGSMLAVADVNGDGRNDVVTGEQGDPTCSSWCQMDWFENTGSGWTKHVLATGVYCHDVAWADLNGDGRPDMSCADLENSAVYWVEHPADPTQPWPVHLIATSATSTMGMQIADIDGDGHPDIVSGEAWFDNVNGDGSAWVRHPYTTMPGPSFVGTVDYSDRTKMSVLDLNGDGRPDIVSALFTESPTSQLWAFLAPADPTTQAWTPVEIDPGPLFAVHSLAAADFDGSGRPQIAVGESDPGGWNFGPNPDLQLVIYTLVGSNPADPSSWQKTTVDTIEAHELRVADLNGDGKPDLIANTENSDLLTPPQIGQVHWWQNNLGGANATPSNASPPSVFGNAQQGQTLTSATDGWTGSTPITLSYQWQDCAAGGGSCGPIDGATSASYLLGSADVGRTVRLVVTATNSAGSSSFTSLATATIAASSAIPTPTTAPTISGNPQQGTLLTASTGSWTGSPGDFSFQWTQCDSSGAGCSTIATATRQNYLPTSADVGHALRVEVTAANSNGATLATTAPTTAIGSSNAAVLGRASIGPLQTGGRGGQLDANGPYTLTTPATVSTLSAYLGTPFGTITLRGAIYADNGSGTRPGALIAVTTQATIAANAPATWINLTFPTTLSLQPGSYWLAYWYGSSDGHYYYTPQAGADQYTSDGYSSTGSPNNPYGTPTTDNRAYTLYATYTPTTTTSPPTNTTPPTITGTTQQGQTLNTSTGVWSGSPTGYAYEWRRCDAAGAGCVAIGGATSAGYTLTLADVGATLRVAVTASNGGGSATAVSVQTAVVAAAPTGGSFGQSQVGTLVDSGGAGYLDLSGPYTVSGTVTVTQLNGYMAGSSAASRIRGVIYTNSGGQPGTLVAVTSEVSLAANRAAGWLVLPLASPVQLAAGSYWLGYWYADGNSRHYYLNVAGAERYKAAAYSSTGNPPASFGTASSASSSYSLTASFVPAGSPPANTGLPAISGSPVNGQPLSASTGTWSGSPTSYAYEWRRCDTTGAGCVAIAGASGTGYTLVSADVGATLRVAVTASNAAGSTTAVSAQTPVVAQMPPPANSGLPAISGSAVVGQLLSASTGVWSGNPTGYAYEWRRCDTTGAACTAILAATGSTYTLTVADLGSTIRVAVTASNPGGNTTAVSTQTAVVAQPPPPANSGLPAISGSAVVGQLLSASTGVWSGNPTSYAYEWRRCDTTGAACTAILAATGSTYTLTVADLGSTIRVAVTASNPGGNTTALSTQTAVVAAAPTGGSFGQSQVGTLVDTGGAGYLDLSGPYTVSGTVTVTQLNGYMAGSSAASRIRGVIYTNSGGQPGTLVAVTSEVSLAANRAAGWVTLPLTTPVQLAAGSYWLGYWYADGNSRHYYLNLAGAERYKAAAYSSTANPPASFGTASSASSSYSLTATYTLP